MNKHFSIPNYKTVSDLTENGIRTVLFADDTGSTVVLRVCPEKLPPFENETENDIHGRRIYISYPKADSVARWDNIAVHGTEIDTETWFLVLESLLSQLA